MHKRSVALLLSVTTAAAVLGIGEAARADGASAPAVVLAENVDQNERGKELFESLFFLQGGSRTRALLKEADVSSLTDAEVEAVLREVRTEESIARVRQIERELAADDPDYFSTLGALIGAGDPVEVQRGLTSAYNEMLRTPTMAAAVASLEAEQTYVPGEIGTDCGVAAVVALGVALVVTAVAALNYALAANIALGFNVAAGTNYAYQSNAVKTRSKTAGPDASERFSEGVVAAVIKQFGN